MRYVRFRGPNGVETGKVEDGHVVTGGGTRIELLDPETHVLAEPYELLAPIAAPEVWCAGVTYERSRDARVAESALKDVYTLVYDAPRPELTQTMSEPSWTPGATSTRVGSCCMKY